MIIFRAFLLNEIQLLKFLVYLMENIFGPYIMLISFREVLLFNYWSRKFSISHSENDSNAIKIGGWGLLIGFNAGKQLILNDTEIEMKIIGKNEKRFAKARRILVGRTPENKLICMIDPLKYMKNGDRKNRGIHKIRQEIVKRNPKLPKISDEQLDLENDLHLLYN